MSADRYVNEILGARHESMNRLIGQVRTEIGHGPRLVPRLARGAPETAIHEQSRQIAADLVVMGAVARTGLSGMFIGNRAETLISSLACPVRAVVPDGFVSPILRG